MHARMSCRVARPLGAVPQRVQVTRTSPNHSSTATHAGAAQVRHHRCPVKATTCTGEDTHWCNQRWCRRQLIRSNGSRPDSSATSSAARRAVSGATLLSACRGPAGFGVAASGDKCGDALEGGGQRVDACHGGGDGVRVPTRSPGERRGVGAVLVRRGLALHRLRAVAQARGPPQPARRAGRGGVPSGLRRAPRAAGQDLVPRQDKVA